jgi:hypothetical protein
MTDSPEKIRLQAKGKQLKLLMVFMMAFMVLGPLLGPVMFADEFSQLHGMGLYIFYIGTPVMFGIFFLFLPDSLSAHSKKVARKTMTALRKSSNETCVRPQASAPLLKILFFL